MRVNCGMLKCIIPSPKNERLGPRRPARVSMPPHDFHNLPKIVVVHFNKLSIYRFNPATRPAIVKNAAALPPTTIAPLAGLVDALEAEPEPVAVPEPDEPVVVPEPVPPG